MVVEKKIIKQAHTFFCVRVHRISCSLIYEPEHVRPFFKPAANLSLCSSLCVRCMFCRYSVASRSLQYSRSNVKYAVASDLQIVHINHIMTRQGGTKLLLLRPGQCRGYWEAINGHFVLTLVILYHLNLRRSDLLQLRLSKTRNTFEMVQRFIINVIIHITLFYFHFYFLYCKIGNM